MRAGRGPTWAAVAWAPHSRRSEMFARELGAELHCVHYLRFQSPPHAPLKYLLQSVRTLQVLFRRRPRAVHVQNPPCVCALVVHLYCLLTGARFVIEHHSAAFDPIWRLLLPLQKYVSRRAATNIVTSEHWAQLVRSWGGHAVVLYDAFLDLPEGEPYPVRAGFNVALIGTFASDEPIDAVLDAAALVPEVHFYITGDLTRAPAGVTNKAPANVTFTGFLDMNGSYLGLLRGVDAAMVLTTRNHTLQLGGCEAIAVGKPLITSDWPYLRQLFSRATVVVSPSADSIAAGVREVVRRRAELAAEIEPYRLQQRRRWDEGLREVERRAGAVGAKHARAGAEAQSPTN